MSVRKAIQRRLNIDSARVKMFATHMPRLFPSTSEFDARNKRFFEVCISYKVNLGRRRNPRDERSTRPRPFRSIHSKSCSEETTGSRRNVAVRRAVLPLAFHATSSPSLSLAGVQKRLEELIAISYKPVSMNSYDPYALLREMKEQQHINEKALEYVRGRYSHSLEYAQKPLRGTSFPFFSSCR